MYHPRRLKKRDISWYRLEQRSRATRMKNLSLSLLFLLLGFGSLGVLGYFLLQRYFQPQEMGEVLLSIDGPNRVTPGTAVTYQFVYENQSQVPLNEALLQATFSSGFFAFQNEDVSFTKIKDTHSERIWQIGDILPQDKKDISLTMTPIAPSDTQQFIKLILFYTPANFNSPFKKTATKTISLLPSPVALEIEGPKQRFVDEDTLYTVTVTNITQKPLEKIKFVITPEKNFQPTPHAATNGQDPMNIEIPLLLPDAKKIFTLSGKFVKAEPKDTLLLVELFLSAPDGYHLQEKKNFTTSILGKESVMVNLLLNGSTENAATALGGKLSYSLIMENTSQQEFKDLRIQALFEPTHKELFQKENIESQFQGTLQQEDNRFSLTWTKKESPELATLQPTEKKAFNFQLTLPTREQLSQLSSQILSSAIFKSFIRINMKTQGTNKENTELTLETKHFENPLNSDLSLVVEKKGPLPTLLESAEEEFEIIWRVSNTFHEITDLNITTHLPSSTTWKESTHLPAGNISFDESAKTITWTLNKLPRDAPPLQISFRIASKKQDAIHTLLETTTLTGKDTITNDTITIINHKIEYNANGPD